MGWVILVFFYTMLIARDDKMMKAWSITTYSKCYSKGGGYTHSSLLMENVIKGN